MEQRGMVGLYAASWATWGVVGLPAVFGWLGQPSPQVAGPLLWLGLVAVLWLPSWVAVTLFDWGLSGWAELENAPGGAWIWALASTSLVGWGTAWVGLQTPLAEGRVPEVLTLAVLQYGTSWWLPLLRRGATRRRLRRAQASAKWRA